MNTFSFFQAEKRGTSPPLIFRREKGDPSPLAFVPSCIPLWEGGSNIYIQRHVYRPTATASLSGQRQKCIRAEIVKKAIIIACMYDIEIKTNECAWRYFTYFASNNRITMHMANAAAAGRIIGCTITNWSRVHGPVSVQATDRFSE